MTRDWQGEATTFSKRSLAGTGYVCCRVGGIHFKVRLEQDGALGFWSAVREVFPETREQRCWWHKIGNVLNALPESAQPGAEKALAFCGCPAGHRRRRGCRLGKGPRSSSGKTRLVPPGLTHADIGI